MIADLLGLVERPLEREHLAISWWSDVSELVSMQQIACAISDWKACVALESEDHPVVSPKATARRLFFEPIGREWLRLGPQSVKLVQKSTLRWINKHDGEWLRQIRKALTRSTSSMLPLDDVLAARVEIEVERQRLRLSRFRLTAYSILTRIHVQGGNYAAGLHRLPKTALALDRMCESKDEHERFTSEVHRLSRARYAHEPARLQVLSVLERTAGRAFIWQGWPAWLSSYRRARHVS